MNDFDKRWSEKYHKWVIAPFCFPAYLCVIHLLHKIILYGNYCKKIDRLDR
jgi:hypothetical protein